MRFHPCLPLLRLAFRYRGLPRSLIRDDGEPGCPILWLLWEEKEAPSPHPIVGECRSNRQSSMSS